MLNCLIYLLYRHSEPKIFLGEESRTLVAKTGFFALIKHQAQNDGGLIVESMK